MVDKKRRYIVSDATGQSNLKVLVIAVDTAEALQLARTMGLGFEKIKRLEVVQEREKEKGK